MRTLEQALQDHELITLRVIGEWWEVDLTGMEKSDAVAVVSGALRKLDMGQEKQYLPPEEASALDELIAQGGRVAVAALNRSYGDVRQMGPGRMEREEPWLDPISPLEALWYRGFIFRAFDETADGLLEFYYLPQEYVAQFPQAFDDDDEKPAASLAAAVPPDGPAVPDNSAVDDLATLLALALRMAVMDEEKRLPLTGWLLNPDPDRHSLLINLAGDKGWLRESETGLRPTRAVVDWLKKGREAQLFELAEAWSNSNWNDLCHTPGLICEGDNWQNDPISARTALLEALPQTAEWYTVASLIDQIHQANPDFQRPDGNYDTWYIRDAGGGGYLAGYEAWHLVEGRLLHFLISGPMQWLGLVMLSGEPDDRRYRLSDVGLKWLTRSRPAAPEQKPPVVIRADGSLIVDHATDRYFRFQITRIAELEQVDRKKPYQYRLTPASLALAERQGISAERLLRFLDEVTDAPLPKGLHRALERWSENGVESRLEEVIVLRAKDAQILDTIRSNPKTSGYLGESLGDLSVTVLPGKWRNLRAACAQLGLLIDENVTG